MNKTLKTVLITLAATLVFLIAVVMIFGEDTPSPADSTTQEAKNVEAVAEKTEQNTSTKCEEATASSTANNIKKNTAKSTTAKSTTAGMSKELYDATIAYDIFDWNGADEQGKVKMVKDIIKIWNESGSSCEMTATDLVEYINQNLSDQANIFEVACMAAQIDPLPYFK